MTKEKLWYITVDAFLGHPRRALGKAAWACDIQPEPAQSLSAPNANRAKSCEPSALVAGWIQQKVASHGLASERLSMAQPTAESRHTGLVPRPELASEQAAQRSIAEVMASIANVRRRASNASLM